MRLTLFLIVLLIFSAWVFIPELQQALAADPTGQDLELVSFVFGALVAGSVGLLVYRVRVWGKTTTELFEVRKASLKDSPSAFKLLADALASLFWVIGILVLIIIVVVRYYGLEEEVATHWEFITGKGQKLIEFLSQP